MAAYSIFWDNVFDILIVVALTALAIRGLAWNYVTSFLASGWTTG